MECNYESFISQTFITSFAQSENRKAGFWTVPGAAFSFSDGARKTAGEKVKGACLGSSRYCFNEHLSTNSLLSSGGVLKILFL